MTRMCIGGTLATITLLAMLVGPMAVAMMAADDQPRGVGASCLDPRAQAITCDTEQG